MCGNSPFDATESAGGMHFLNQFGRLDFTRDWAFLTCEILAQACWHWRNREGIAPQPVGRQFIWELLWCFRALFRKMVRRKFTKLPKKTLEAWVVIRLRNQKSCRLRLLNRILQLGMTMGLVAPSLMIEPQFSGVWQLNVEKSVLRGVAPSKTLMKIEHDGSKIVQRVLAIDGDGKETLAVFNYDTDGETTNNLEAGTVRSRARWEGAELAIESWVQTKGGELRLVDYWSLSDDGMLLTMAHRDDALAGQISILERASEENATLALSRLSGIS